MPELPELPPELPGTPGSGPRERILGRLRAAQAGHPQMPADAGHAADRAAAGHAAGPAGAGDAALAAGAGDPAVLARKVWPPAERIARLRQRMEAVKAEFLEATAATWPAAVRELLRGAGARTLWAGGGGPLAAPLAAAGADGGAPQLRLYDRPVEELKESLFTAADAGITTCLGGIAETGGLILCPSAREPRLLSLVPPIHLVLLDPARIWDTLWHAVRGLGWGRSIPPNALVISGPSKTADIEQTLAYGVHGPKRLVVVLVPGAPASPPDSSRG
jgi:L-lactate dehydrogenase complex protein LldG